MLPCLNVNTWGKRVVLGEMLKYGQLVYNFLLEMLRIVVGEKPDSCGVAALGDVVGEVLADNKLNTRCCLLHFVPGMEELFL